MSVDKELVDKLVPIFSRGLNPEAEKFNEVLGLTEEEFNTIIAVAERIWDESDTIHGVFLKVLEIWDYIPDKVVKGLLMFHIGVRTGKHWAEKDELKSFVDVFKKGYSQGFSEGFKEGIKTFKQILKDNLEEEEDN